jgi:SAM-dependent MidA family methyltransferase
VSRGRKIIPYVGVRIVGRARFRQDSGVSAAVGWRGWAAATADALYGPGGFYHRPEGGPGAHYRTSSTASPLFAEALARLVADVDLALGRPDPLDLVEVGAARGALLTAVAAALPAELRERTRLTGVELAQRPPTAGPDVRWVADLRDVEPVRGVLLANEWLDNVPVDVVELTGDGPRYLEVDPTGTERLGRELTPADADWLATWWPLVEEGDRGEIGRPRDEAWATTVARLDAGLALAVDYSHTREERAAGAWAGGTLTGYREGRAVLPVPDGSCDITAHVALDACAAAVAGAETLLTDQRTALRALGVRGTRPEYDAGDPAGWLRRLSAAGGAAELTARGGLGDFGWLLHARGCPLPALPREADRGAPTA